LGRIQTLDAIHPLSKCVEALGGHLEVRAVFPGEGTIFEVAAVH
jgi:hypothetical protein